MNKNTYVLGIFFLLIAVAAGALHSVLLLIQGFSLVHMQSYATWYLAFGLFSLAANLFVLRYYYIKQWRFVFIAGTISIVFSVIQFVREYIMLIRVGGELVEFHRMIVVGSVLTTLVVAVGLIVQARYDRILLSLAILMIAVGTTMLGAAISLILGLGGEALVNVIIGVGIISNLLPIFFIAIFQREAKHLQPLQPSSTAGGVLFNAALAVAVIATVCLVVIGYQLSIESYWYQQWGKRGPIEARKLAQRFEARVYVNDKQDTLSYLLLTPFDYDSMEQYPLVTCLHGGPTRVATNVEVTQPAQLLSEPDNRKKYPAFLFVPQGRPGVLWGGIPSIPSMDSIVFEAMDALEREFNIDEDRLYVSGVSGGGYGTWHFICTFPNKFAAAMPICGGGDPTLADKIAHVPVWAFHGDADRNVHVTGSRNMIEAIRRAGGNPRYNEYAGVGHNVWPEIEKTQGLLEWMFEQKRRRVE